VKRENEMIFENYYYREGKDGKKNRELRTLEVRRKEGKKKEKKSVIEVCGKSTKLARPPKK